MNLGKNRVCGILAHPTSLPGPHGIGSLGSHARAFVDFLHEAGQSLWQVLPLGPTGYGDSPYACFSTFAGNPLLIDLEALAADGLVDATELQQAPQGPGRVDFGAVVSHRLPLLHRVASRFSLDAPPDRKREFEAFCDTHRWWLEDFALFCAIKKAHGSKPLSQWDTGARRRDPEVIRRAHADLRDELTAVRVQQFYFFSQWQSLRAYAATKGVRVLGDMPIFVAYDSSDVWSHPELFKLDQDLSPQVVAGVPPDYFSATGQLWGNPLYNWKVHAETGFTWWLDRLRHALTLADIVRLDHFRGFEAAWEVPAGEQTAEHGQWVPGPGDVFFDAIHAKLGDSQLVAEDLGIITDQVRALRDRHRLPGMHVLHFGFSPYDERIYAPHNCIRNSVVYTGTHDNDTTIGWFQTLPHEERELVKAYLNTDGSSIHWTMIQTAYGTVARTVIIPVQDVLGLGSEGRMNTPGIGGSSWSFRMSALPHPALASRLRTFGRLYERLPKERPSAA